MNNKYYTPDISEFCVGFEYQTSYDKGESWRKLSIKELSDYDDLTDDLRYNEIRVKSLNNQDVEELDFIPLDKDALLQQHGWTHASSSLKYLLSLRELDGSVNIMNHKRGMLIFVGWLKNKFELKKVLQQVGYYD